MFGWEESPSCPLGNPPLQRRILHSGCAKCANQYGKHGGPLAFQTGESIALQGTTAELAAMAKREAAWHGELQVSGVQNGAGGALLKGFVAGKMWEKSQGMSINYIT